MEWRHVLAGLLALFVAFILGMNSYEPKGIRPEILNNRAERSVAESTRTDRCELNDRLRAALRSSGARFSELGDHEGQLSITAAGTFHLKLTTTYGVTMEGHLVSDGRALRGLILPTPEFRQRDPHFVRLTRCHDGRWIGELSIEQDFTDARLNVTARLMH